MEELKSKLSKHYSESRSIEQLEELKESSLGAIEPFAILVMLGDSVGDWDKKIEQVTSTVSSITGEKYLAVVTGFQSRQGVSPRRELQLNRQLAAGPISFGPLLFPQGNFVRMTPNLFLGLILGLILLFTSLLYFYCLGAVQTPNHFAKKYPSLGKVSGE